MKLTVGGVLGDAAALWRAERDVLIRLSGVFFLLPILALLMLLTTLPAITGERGDGEAVFAAVRSFYAANFVWLLLASLALDFGALAVLDLFLHRGGTVRDLLVTSLMRMLPFVLIGFLTGSLINIGFALYVIPGLYAFGRCWMMGAAYAAEPGNGILAAIERGFRMSAGNGWRIALLGCGTAAIAGSGAMVLLILAQVLTALAGNAAWVQALALVLPAAAAAAAYAAFTLVRIAAYRRLAGSISGT